jgi:RES domain-containing protein
VTGRPVRDNELIDALETAPRVRFDDAVWRVVRADRDPLRGAAARGRWDDGTFDVLYTAAEADGACAEMHFHIARGQPVFPSRIAFKLYALRARLERALSLADLGALARLGVDERRFGALEYVRRGEEYGRSQEIAEVVRFLDFDGLIVPSARWPCSNVVLFTDRVPPDALRVEADHGVVDWSAWKARTRQA